LVSGTASVASGERHSSFVPIRKIKKIVIILIAWPALPEGFAKRFRIRNLRFAYCLCVAQTMSMAAHSNVNAWESALNTDWWAGKDQRQLQKSGNQCLAIGISIA
jgi:hypothetical protein